MWVRRCASLVVEPVTQLQVDIAALLQGGIGVSRQGQWQVLAAHLDAPVVVTAAQLALLAVIDPLQWQARDSLQPSMSGLDALLHAGLVLADPASEPHHNLADAHVRDGHWHGLSAVYARHARWHDCDAVQAMDSSGTATAQGLRTMLGPPPPAALDIGAVETAIALPRCGDDALARLLRRRVTCRNFRTDRSMPLHSLARVLELTFSVHGQVRVDAETVFLKRSSPSAGGLHALEAFVLVQRVEGVQAGWHHYRPLEHRLAAMGQADAAALQEQALALLAGQHWFADAPVLVVIAARYQRTFWKYRGHAKALRALLLEAGHFSQTLYLSATDAGLGAFVTCAVNEPVIERALGLEPLHTGVLAVCGIGERATDMTTAEMDPAGAVWAPAG
jgi:putative peptide maturation dehydrogenase